MAGEWDCCAPGLSFRFAEERTLRLGGHHQLTYLLRGSPEEYVAAGSSYVVYSGRFFVDEVKRRRPASMSMLPISPSNAARASLTKLFFRCILLSLKALNEYIRRARNMVAAQRFRFRAIASDDCVKDRHVFLQNCLRHLRIVAQDLAHDTT
jgi:hypothetical protein